MELFRIEVSNDALAAEWRQSRELSGGTKGVMLAGGGIGIRASLNGEKSFVLSVNHVKSPTPRRW
jgi:hypothetical protein